MTSYYPSQAGYGQPAVYASTSGYGQAYPVAGSYAQPAVMAPQMVPSVGVVAAPMMVQSSYGGHHYHDPYSFGARFRRFFGLAPRNGIRYKNNRSTWGFMGYSRRPRYTDARTGGEVDRLGRPVYRI